MSAAKHISSVIYVINSLVDVSGFAVMAPKICPIAQIFNMMLLWLCVLVSSAHAHVVNLCMQASYVASDVI